MTPNTLALRALSIVLLAPFWLASSASAQVQFVNEVGIDVLPIDLAVTPDGLVGVVRSTDDSSAGQMITIWDLDTGTELFFDRTTCQFGWGTGNAGYPTSDAIQATNSRAIAVGSRDDVTYVDILHIDPNEPPVCGCLANYALTGTTNQTKAGDVNDVAITPNGLFAVVNHKNWIHVFNLRSGAIAGQFNIGSYPSGIARPGACAGSVAVTDSRAIVLTSRGGLGGTRMWVYILNLVDGPSVMLEQQMALSQPTFETDPHDVAITPDGTRAVVTGGRVVGLFNLVTALSSGKWSILPRTA